jgi:beta-glucosidase/6-phospho-beta-glucosidase/beta-galactosidase
MWHSPGIEEDRFIWATGIENSFIPQSLPGLRSLDEYELTQHYTQWKGDLDLAAEAGVQALRWGIPWYRVQPSPDKWDWRWADEVLDYMVNVKGLTPILDLMHYGTPLWLEASFADARYPRLVAEYARAVAARYKSLARFYTPLNEPTVNAQMCGRAGQWPPYLTGHDGYLLVLMALARGIVLTQRALRAEQPDMVSVQVEALGRHWTRDESLTLACEQANAHPFLSLDLTMGRVDDRHTLYPWLRDNGVGDETLRWFQDNAVTFDVVGGNHYPWCYREMVRRPDGTATARPGPDPVHGATLGGALSALHERAQGPVMVTETSAKGTVAARGAWLDETLDAVRQLRAAGVPVVGYTWFPLFTMIEWEYRPAATPLADHLLHLGLYDAAFDADGVLRRYPTPLVERFREQRARGMPEVGEAVGG